MPLSVPSDWQGQPGTTLYMRWRELYNSTIGTAELGSGDSSVRTGGARGGKQPTIARQQNSTLLQQLAPAFPSSPMLPYCSTTASMRHRRPSSA
jgi:hypothetical protein